MCAIAKSINLQVEERLPDDASILVLTCYGHIFKFDFTLFWHNSLRMLRQPVCLHMFVLPFRPLWDSHRSSGCIAFDISSIVFPECEPYGAALNTTVLSKESMCLFLEEFLANT